MFVCSNINIEISCFTVRLDFVALKEVLRKYTCKNTLLAILILQKKTYLVIIVLFQSHILLNISYYFVIVYPIKIHHHLNIISAFYQTLRRVSKCSI